jgi:hypothetical protein
VFISRTTLSEVLALFFVPWLFEKQYILGGGGSKINIPNTKLMGEGGTKVNLPDI